jgi:hypothetical protein
VSKPFRGVINVDVRDSEPDWRPFEPPRAPDGAPSVLYIVLDVGFSALGGYGGPVETPNIDHVARQGVRYTQWHTTALCSPTRSRLLTGRNRTRNSMACSTEAVAGVPNASGTIPPENGMLPEMLGELGRNTYMTRKRQRVPPRPCRQHRRSGRPAAADPGRAAAASLPANPPDRRTDRRASVHLDPHGQCRGQIDLPQAGRGIARRRGAKSDGDRPARRVAAVGGAAVPVR